MKAPKTQKSRNHTQGVEDYKTIPQSAFLVKENKVPQDVQVISDNEFYGDYHDQFNYAEFAHSKRKHGQHERKVISSFNGDNSQVQQWITKALKEAVIHARITFK